MTLIYEAAVCVISFVAIGVLFASAIGLIVWPVVMISRSLLSHYTAVDTAKTQPGHFTQLTDCWSALVGRQHLSDRMS
jgi:hypothetical protein